MTNREQFVELKALIGNDNAFKVQNKLLKELLKKSDGVSEKYTSTLDEIHNTIKELKKSNEQLTKQVNTLENEIQSYKLRYDLCFFIGAICIVLLLYAVLKGV
jgi:uncharacterized protein YlxW (UPF0749 family)